MSSNDLHGEVYYPSDEIKNNAHIPNWDDLQKEASEDYDKFWEKRADELHWFKKWDKVIDSSDKPFYKWFKHACTSNSDVLSSKCSNMYTVEKAESLVVFLIQLR